MNPQKTSCLRVVAALLGILLGTVRAFASGGTAEKFAMAFSGTASGGSLILYQMPEGRNLQRSINVMTTQGESAESVVRKLADVLTQKDPFGWQRARTPANRPPYAAGTTLQHLPGNKDGMLLLGGEETGLGIPEAPRALTARYDPARDQIVLRWENPPAGYDSVAVVWDGWGVGPMPGTTTEFIHDRKVSGPGRRPENLNIAVVGYRNGVPSPAGSVRLDKSVQEEAVGLPFSNGIAPNWVAWKTGDASTVQFKQEERRGKQKGKLFYQSLRVNQPSVQAGLWRKFVGLVPGHTYKVSAWMSTNALDTKGGEWSYSLHATYLAPNKQTLTVEEMLGQAALPDGRSGPTAGCIAAFKPGVTTHGKFDLATTDPAKPSPGRQATNVTLPAGVDTLIVWVRLRCSDPQAGGVALDHLALEDLSFGQ